MELSLFKKSYLSKLGTANVPYKIINSAAFNSKFGNVRIYSDEYKDGWMHLIYIDEKVYVLPSELFFHASSPKFPKSAAIIPFATLTPFNPSFIGEVKAYKKNEFSTAKVTQENVSGGVKYNNVADKIEEDFKALISKYKAKSKEYATNSWDSNFVKGANILQTTKEEVLLGYVTKHLVSIVDIVKGKSATMDVIREKIGDAQIYLALLQVMFEEKN